MIIIRQYYTLFSMKQSLINQKLSEITEKIVNEFKPEKIILFGSYAWGNPNTDSDIDLFVVKKTDKSRLERGVEAEKILWGFGVPIDILVYTPEEVQNRLQLKDFFIENIFTKGKILYSAF